MTCLHCQALQVFVSPYIYCNFQNEHHSFSGPTCFIMMPTGPPGWPLWPGNRWIQNPVRNCENSGHALNSRDGRTCSKSSFSHSHFVDTLPASSCKHYMQLVGTSGKHYSNGNATFFILFRFFPVSSHHIVPHSACQPPFHHWSLVATQIFTSRVAPTKGGPLRPFLFGVCCCRFCLPRKCVQSVIKYLHKKRALNL